MRAQPTPGSACRAPRVTAAIAQAATGAHVAGVPCPPSATEPSVRTLTRRQIEVVPPSAVTAVEDGAAHVHAVEAQAVQAAGTSVAGGCVTHTVVGSRGDFKLATLIAFSQFGFQEKEKLEGALPRHCEPTDRRRAQQCDLGEAPDLTQILEPGFGVKCETC